MEEPRKMLTFSAAQNRIITSSLTLLCIAVFVVGVGFILFGLLFSLNYLLNIIGPIIVAFFLSLLTMPVLLPCPDIGLTMKSIIRIYSYLRRKSGFRLPGSS